MDYIRFYHIDPYEKVLMLVVFACGFLLAGLMIYTCVTTLQEKSFEEELAIVAL